MATPNLNLLCIISCLTILHSPYLIAYELIYHTENSDSLQYYDCIYYTSNRITKIETSTLKLEIKQNILGVKYCRQLLKTTSLQRPFFLLNSTCYHDGVLLSFFQLKSQNVSATDVLKFSSSVEQANKYAVYLSNVTNVDNDKFLCNCIRPGTFGKFCEYQFYYNSLSFDEAITKQFESSYDSLEGNQFHNNRPCYATLVCDSGLMCLDWRNICDGKC
jgi:hypothetical protein